MFLSAAFFAYNTKVHHDMEETPFKAFRGCRANLPEHLVFPVPGEPAKEEAVQLQDTMGRFEVFYMRMQRMFQGIPVLVDYKWRVSELVWFHAPLKICQRNGQLIKTT